MVRGRAFPILALLILSAVGAELLAAYNDSTGRPGAIAFGVVFFAALYGCPALLIREVSRRAGRGWWTIVLLAAAFGLFEAGVVDQALFADSYGEVRGWEETLRATYVDPFGIAAFPAQNYVVGHVLFSFCAPIALAEAMRPTIAHSPWLGRPGIVVAVSAWLLAAGLVFAEALGEGYASVSELTATFLLAAALVLAAFRGPLPTSATRRAPRERTVLAASFVLTTAATAVPETWIGFAIAIGVTAAGIWLLLRYAGGPGLDVGAHRCCRGRCVPEPRHSRVSLLPTRGRDVSAAEVLAQRRHASARRGCRRPCAPASAYPLVRA